MKRLKFTLFTEFTFALGKAQTLTHLHLTNTSFVGQASLTHEY